MGRATIVIWLIKRLKWDGGNPSRLNIKNCTTYSKVSRTTRVWHVLTREHIQFYMPSARLSTNACLYCQTIEHRQCSFPIPLRVEG